MQFDWKQNAFWNNPYEGNLNYKVLEKSISWSKEVKRFLQSGISRGCLSLKTARWYPDWKIVFLNIFTMNNTLVSNYKIILRIFNFLIFTEFWHIFGFPLLQAKRKQYLPKIQSNFLPENRNQKTLVFNLFTGWTNILSFNFLRYFGKFFKFYILLTYPYRQRFKDAERLLKIAEIWNTISQMCHLVCESTEVYNREIYVLTL
jgi:hypothetical protein